jgi:hypothetical protein
MSKIKYSVKQTTTSYTELIAEKKLANGNVAVATIRFDTEAVLTKRAKEELRKVLEDVWYNIPITSNTKST